MKHVLDNSTSSKRCHQFHRVIYLPIHYLLYTWNTWAPGGCWAGPKGPRLGRAPRPWARTEPPGLGLGPGPGPCIPHIRYCGSGDEWLDKVDETFLSFWIVLLNCSHVRQSKLQRYFLIYFLQKDIRILKYGIFFIYQSILAILAKLVKLSLGNKHGQNT